jgi:hypothetical protein
LQGRRLVDVTAARHHAEGAEGLRGIRFAGSAGAGTGDEAGP